MVKGEGSGGSETVASLSFVFCLSLCLAFRSAAFAAVKAQAVPRTKSSRALPNQITTPPASTIEPSNSAGDLQYLGWLFSSI